MGLYHKDFTVICGHYGCGKTNLSINLAIEAAHAGKKTTLVDFDIVNPYFRSSDYAGLLEKNGVRLIAPVYAGSTMDLPMIPPEVHSIFGGDGLVIIDAGGDGVGATVLGRFADRISAMDYDMLYVVNQYRVQSANADAAINLLREIEEASHLKATAIVNNSHLMYETKPETVFRSAAFAEEAARAAGLAVRGTLAPMFLSSAMPEGAYHYVDIHVRPPWTYGV
ncbi:MAG: hypothetical protein FWF83_07895 [Clostridiales bacterium]|nr:hypothetical protein [Clostridiales bacterium]